MKKLFWTSAAALALVAAPAMADTAATYDGTTLTGLNGTSAALAGGGAVTGAALIGPWNAAGWDGAFLRNETTGLTQFTLTNLPTHSAIQLSFLLGFLDSWDSVNGSPAPDLLSVYIDGSLAGILTSNNAGGNVQEFNGGTLLYFGQQIDDNLFYTDALVDMSTASWASFAHSSSSLTLAFQVGGAGWQGGSDERWGLDALTVSYTSDVGGAVPEPASWAMMIGGLAVVGGAMRRRRTAVSFA